MHTIFAGISVGVIITYRAAKKYIVCCKLLVKTWVCQLLQYLTACGTLITELY